MKKIYQETKKQQREIERVKKIKLFKEVEEIKKQNKKKNVDKNKNKKQEQLLNRRKIKENEVENVKKIIEFLDKNKNEYSIIQKLSKILGVSHTTVRRIAKRNNIYIYSRKK